VQELVAREVAIDVVAAHVADKDVVDGERAVEADRLAMIGEKFGRGG
jgi:hypothetical protein